MIEGVAKNMQLLEFQTHCFWELQSFVCHLLSDFECFLFITLKP